ncbi:unnamed protein product [Schistosoma mattheei]|uniref:Uncharacterized protein n=1 Tax=Schistosoma mattheei TaxID=31246 RepID=A0A183PKS7_9TREM|nr:unnamed protein product [Schistosoma mattheei]
MVRDQDQSDGITSSLQIPYKISANLTAKTEPSSLKISVVSPSVPAALHRFTLLTASSTSLRVGELTSVCHSVYSEMVGNPGVAEG